MAAVASQLIRTSKVRCFRRQVEQNPDCQINRTSIDARKHQQDARNVAKPEQLRNLIISRLQVFVN
jgi:hypothetical protein